MRRIRPCRTMLSLPYKRSQPIAMVISPDLSRFSPQHLPTCYSTRSPITTSLNLSRLSLLSTTTSPSLLHPEVSTSLNLSRFSPSQCCNISQRVAIAISPTLLQQLLNLHPSLLERVTPLQRSALPHPYRLSVSVTQHSINFNIDCVKLRTATTFYFMTCEHKFTFVCYKFLIPVNSNQQRDYGRQQHRTWECLS
jgi:hypothetical protein